MEIPKELRDAGWRKKPDDATFNRWAESGGVWASMLLMPDPVEGVAPTEPGKWYRNGIVNSVYFADGELQALLDISGSVAHCPVKHLTGWQCQVGDAVEVWRPLRHDPRGWGEQPAPVKICGVCYGFGITRAVYKSAQKCSECDGMGYKESEAKNAQPAPVVPDRAGWWWRKDKKDPTRVVKTTTGFVYYTDTEDFIEDVEDDGQWLGPCVKPEAPNGKP